MLDGVMHLGRLVVPYVLGEKTLHLSVGRTLAEYREVEQYITAMRRNPVDVIKQAADLPANVLGLLVAESIKVASAPTYVRGDEYQSFESSPRGMAFDVWRALRDNEEEFGMIPQGEKRNAAYVFGGKRYTLGPDEGVQKVLDLFDEYGGDAIQELARIARASSQQVALGNSNGPTETTGQTQTPTES